MKSEILNCFWGSFFVFFPKIGFARIICFVCKIIVKHHIISANTNGSQCSAKLLQICVLQIFSLVTDARVHFIQEQIHADMMYAAIALSSR